MCIYIVCVCIWYVCVFVPKKECIYTYKYKHSHSSTYMCCIYILCFLYYITYIYVLSILAVYVIGSPAVHCSCAVFSPGLAGSRDESLPIGRLLGDLHQQLGLAGDHQAGSKTVQNHGMLVLVFCCMFHLGPSYLFLSLLPFHDVCIFLLDHWMKHGRYKNHEGDSYSNLSRSYVRMWVRIGQSARLKFAWSCNDMTMDMHIYYMHTGTTSQNLVPMRPVVTGTLNPTIQHFPKF